MKKDKLLDFMFKNETVIVSQLNMIIENGGKERNELLTEFVSYVESINGEKIIKIAERSEKIKSFILSIMRNHNVPDLVSVQKLIANQLVDSKEIFDTIIYSMPNYGGFSSESVGWVTHLLKELPKNKNDELVEVLKTIKNKNIQKELVNSGISDGFLREEFLIALEKNHRVTFFMQSYPNEIAKEFSKTKGDFDENVLPVLKNINNKLFFEDTLRYLLSDMDKCLVGDFIKKNKETAKVLLGSYESIGYFARKGKKEECLEEDKIINLLVSAIDTQEIENFIKDENSFVSKVLKVLVEDKMDIKEKYNIQSAIFNKAKMLDKEFYLNIGFNQFMWFSRMQDIIVERSNLSFNRSQVLLREDFIDIVRKELESGGEELFHNIYNVNKNKFNVIIGGLSVEQVAIVKALVDLSNKGNEKAKEALRLSSEKAERAWDNSQYANMMLVEGLSYGALNPRLVELVDYEVAQKYSNAIHIALNDGVVDYLKGMFSENKIEETIQLRLSQSGRPFVLGHLLSEGLRKSKIGVVEEIIKTDGWINLAKKNKRFSKFMDDILVDISEDEPLLYSKATNQKIKEKVSKEIVSMKKKLKL